MCLLTAMVLRKASLLHSTCWQLNQKKVWHKFAESSFKVKVVLILIHY